MRISHFRLWLLALLVVAVTPALGQGASTEPQNFFYAGGTMAIGSGCAGTLGISTAAMTFECPDGSVTIPYSSITLMQYRPRLSDQVRHMKLRWKVKPNEWASKKNRLFTVLYKQGDTMNALVLRVLPDDMRPYLAEIELSTGKRIEVSDYRGFE